MKNPSTQKKYCVLIICPHPDDGEIFAPQICIQAIKAGYEVHQLLSCCDEYGSSIDEFKGKRIQRIRKHEMICASKAYGVDQDGNAILKLHWANYIDGFVPFDKKSIDRYKKFILKIKPDIILGPDPFIHCDGHRDHIATGKNYYYALKSINTK
ncbi:MAG: PIG-L family deacetylase, partial [archaeon]|nr:PIG-L family deacetylase [archaeon]